MSSAAPTPTMVCPSCGLSQEGLTKECSRCGCPLSADSHVYRREADGTWSVVKDIDLSSLAPRPFPARRKWISKQGAAIMLALVLVGAVVNTWYWRVLVRHAQQESEAITQYLERPVGRIIPRFRLRYQRSERGDLRVFGETNLPDGAALELQVYAGEVLVAVDYPVLVSGGRFHTRPLLQRGKPFSLASYQTRIRAAFERSGQPPSVLLVVGNLGERLEGPHVRGGDATAGARLEFAEDFVLSQ